MSFISNSDKNIINKSTETIDTDIFFQTDSNNNNENDAPINMISGTLEAQQPIETIDIDKMLNEINNINKPILEKQDEEAKIQEQKSKEEYEKEIQKRQQELLEEKVKKEQEERERIKREEEEELLRLEQEKKNRKKNNPKEIQDKGTNVITSDIKDKLANISEGINNIDINKAKEQIVDNIEEVSEGLTESTQNIKDNVSQDIKDAAEKSIKINTNEKVNKNTVSKEDNKKNTIKKKDKTKKIKEEKEKKPLFPTKDIVKNIKDILPTKESVIKNNNVVKEVKEDEKIDWKEKATHDELTKLKNKTAFDEDIKDFDNKGCILFADVNNLKYANDKIGHFAGDTLLIEISKVLSKNFNDVYRMGGDEFIILTKEKESSIIKKIDSINRNLEQITKKDKSGIIYSVAIGYAYGDGIKDIEDIKNEADENMYLAKQEYKNKHPELNVRNANIDNNDWKSLALIDQNTQLYNKLALSYEKITKNTVVNLIRIIDFPELKREQSDSQLKLLADIIRNSNKDNKSFYINNGTFILLDKCKIDDIVKKANTLSIPIENNSITGIEETIDNVINILEAKLNQKSKKDDKELTYDEKLSITQRKMKDDIKNSHETISDEYLDEILMQIQRKAQDIEIVLIASKDFNTLFIFFDVFEFLDCVYESQDNLDFSYIYAAHSKGAVYYGADEYDKEITDLFQGIADGLKGTTINSTKDISKIPGINIFENIYIN